MFEESGDPSEIIRSEVEADLTELEQAPLVYDRPLVPIDWRSQILRSCAGPIFNISLPGREIRLRQCLRVVTIIDNDLITIIDVNAAWVPSIVQRSPSARWGTERYSL